MELVGSITRFALATYFMKRGSNARPVHSRNEVPWPSPSYEPSFASSDEEESQDAESEFSVVVSTHVSNLRQLRADQRFQDWSRGIAELREYVAVNDLVASLVAVLVEMVKRQPEDIECLVRVIEDMCFEKSGGPSEVFDKLVEALNCYSGDRDTGVVIWLERIVDVVLNGLWKYHEQQFGAAS
ncbi:hypothetical protein GN244_ATG03400 [Phytophthora infestans]|uniref:Uncharacterized protein n=1 Tax=Phytophthora infestans TaxID=4787 RepID=A0A833SQB6_PHYIN|nr:hypothetical protein GN244_ATG03400 [Phytophthora infestans]KAF4127729.1 hypothetical protein GN958_ATG23095 [Phytophthora infestans]